MTWFQRLSNQNKTIVLYETMYELFILNTNIEDLGFNTEISNDVTNSIKWINKLNMHDDFRCILSCIILFSPDRDYDKELDEGKLRKMEMLRNFLYFDGRKVFDRCFLLQLKHYRPVN